jgi:hypothetical protein
MGSVAQIAGAVLVLAAYALLQAGTLTAQSRAFVLLNLVGASILAVVDAGAGRSNASISTAREDWSYVDGFTSIGRPTARPRSASRTR